MPTHIPGLVQGAAVVGDGDFGCRAAQPGVQPYVLFVDDEGFVLLPGGRMLGEAADHLTVSGHILGVPGERQAAETLHGPYLLGVAVEQIGDVGHRVDAVAAEVDVEEVEGGLLGHGFRREPVVRIGVAAYDVAQYIVVDLPALDQFAAFVIVEQHVEAADLSDGVAGGPGLRQTRRHGAEVDGGGERGAA